MLDILIPVSRPNLELLEICVRAIDEFTQNLPRRIILAVDGTVTAERESVRGFMQSRATIPEPNPAGVPATSVLDGDRVQPPPPDWLMIDWPGSVYYQRSIANAFPSCNRDFVAVIPPWIELQDPKWFGKMQMPFAKKRHVMLAAVHEPDAPLNSLPPAQFGRRKHPSSDMVLTRRLVAADVLAKMKKVDGPRAWVEEYSRVVETIGGTRWLIPSVRYQVVQHAEHACQQQERSEEEEARSESPSPTIQSSSTPTTTEADGIGVSAPF